MVVAGEVYDIGRDSHDEGRRKSPPKGSEAFIAGDFAQAIEGGSEILAPRFVDCAICCV